MTTLQSAALVGFGTMRRQTPTDRVADEDIGIEEFDGGNEHEGAEHVLEGNYVGLGHL